MACILALLGGAGLRLAAQPRPLDATRPTYEVEAPGSWVHAGSAWGEDPATLPWEVVSIGSTILTAFVDDRGIHVRFLFLDRLHSPSPGARLEALGYGWGSEQLLWSVPWTGEPDPVMPPVEMEVCRFFGNVTYRLRNGDALITLGMALAAAGRD